MFLFYFASVATMFFWSYTFSCSGFWELWNNNKTHTFEFDTFKVERCTMLNLWEMKIGNKMVERVKKNTILINEYVHLPFKVTFQKLKRQIL